MSICLRRREFVAGLGGAAAWPLAARAQQGRLPVVGVLGAGGQPIDTPQLAGFRKGLAEMGYVENRNVAIEYRYADGQRERLAAFAAELARHQVAVIYAIPTAAAVAAKGATSTIPIVFAIGDDPVAAGLVASFNRPGGNVTGFTGMSLELFGKQLGMLRETVPKAERIAVLVNPTNPVPTSTVADANAAAAIIGLPVEVLTATTNREIDSTFTSLGKNPGAVLPCRRPIRPFPAGDDGADINASQLVACRSGVGQDVPTMFRRRTLVHKNHLLYHRIRRIHQRRSQGPEVSFSSCEQTSGRLSDNKGPYLQID